MKGLSLFFFYRAFYRLEAYCLWQNALWSRIRVRCCRRRVCRAYSALCGKNSRFLQTGTQGRTGCFFITPLPPAASAGVRRHLPCGKAGEKSKSAGSCTACAAPLCHFVSGSRQFPAADCFYHKISLCGKGCPAASRLRLAPCHRAIPWWTGPCSRESCGNLEN